MKPWPLMLAALVHRQHRPKRRRLLLLQPHLLLHLQRPPPS